MSESTTTSELDRTYLVVRAIPGSNTAEDVGYRPQFEVLSEQGVPESSRLAWSTFLGEALEISDWNTAWGLAARHQGVPIDIAEVRERRLNFGEPEMRIKPKKDLTFGLGLGIR